MEKIALSLVLIVGLVVYTQSCKKNTVKDSENVTIEKTLKRNESYKLDLGFFGREEGASITKQAMHYAVSETKRSEGSASMEYNYTPAENYVGKDEVTIQARRGSDGASAGNDIKLTTIKFTITN